MENDTKRNVAEELYEPTMAFALRVLEGKTVNPGEHEILPEILRFLVGNYSS
jgi:hypothetical protein